MLESKRDYRVKLSALPLAEKIVYHQFRRILGVPKT